MTDQAKTKKTAKTKTENTSSEQAPLALANLVSGGMSVKEAKEKLGIK